MRQLALAPVLLLAAVNAGAATILARTVDVDISGATTVERRDLLISIDDPKDIEGWRYYRVQLDDHISLTAASAEILSADGHLRSRIPRRSFERVESTGFGLYTSAWAQLIPFPGLQLGDRLHLRLELRSDVPYRTSNIALQLPSPQRHLQVTVRGGGEQLVWAVRAPDRMFDTRKEGPLLEVTGVDVPGYSGSALVDSGGAQASVLRLSWASRHSWAAVGEWYTEATAGVHRNTEAVARLARSLCAAPSGRRACVEAMADHVRQRVRYEAVSIGEGGWVPSPPEEVLKRGWGDCKDKSFLLSELLFASGIRSHLMLLRAGRAGPIDDEFPMPSQFNHCIVAIPSEQLEARPEDPVSDGLLLVDPTVDRGTISWLSPSLQGRKGLVVDGASSRLIDIPELPQDETRELLLDGRLDREGNLLATVTLRLRGVRAFGWLRSLDSVPASRLEDEARGQLLQPLVPQGQLSAVTWRALEENVPAFEISAELLLDDAARVTNGGRLLSPILLGSLPEPTLIEGRADPLLVIAGIDHSRLTLELPDHWCRVVAHEEVVDNAAGSLSVSVGGDDQRLILDQRLELRRSWIDDGLLQDLGELASAESRAARRRIRLRCAPTENGQPD